MLNFCLKCILPLKFQFVDGKGLIAWTPWGLVGDREAFSYRWLLAHTEHTLFLAPSLEP